MRRAFRHAETEVTATQNFHDNPRHTDWPRFLKFGLTGALNTAVDFLVFTVLSYGGINPYLSQTVSYSAGILNSYVINRSWTFQSKERFFSREMLRFLSVNLALLLLSLGVLWLCGPLPRFIAKLCATAVTMVVGFFVNRLWVFRS